MSVLPAWDLQLRVLASVCCLGAQGEGFGA